MTSIAPIPRLITALVTLAEGLDNVDASDGYSTWNPGNVDAPEGLVSIAVGVDEPGKPSRAASASSTATHVTVGGSRPGFDESGELFVHLHAEHGTTDAAIPRAAVYRVRDQLRDLLCAHRPTAPALDVPGAWRVYLSGERLYQAQYEAGATADLIITVAFTARV